MIEWKKFVRIDEEVVVGDLYTSNHLCLTGDILKRKLTEKDVFNLINEKGGTIDMGIMTEVGSIVVIGGSSGTFGHPVDREDVGYIRRITGEIVERNYPDKTIRVENP